MADLLSKKEAIQLLRLDEKTFTNYFKNADEFHCVERRRGKGRFYFEERELKEWDRSRKWRTIELNFADYALCLDFALAQHFRGYVLSDWGTGRQREFGQKITNWVKGQLAEVAVQKFLQSNYGVSVELDFEIHEDITPQDIIGVREGGKLRKPKIKIGIKSSKPKSAYLVLGENEYQLPERRSDIYIYGRPDMPDDHLLRLTKETIISVVRGQPHFAAYKDRIPPLESIYCEVAGYCRRDELERVTSIPGQEFENGARYVIKSGLLHRNKEEWETLLNKI